MTNIIKVLAYILSKGEEKIMKKNIYMLLIASILLLCGCQKATAPIAPDNVDNPATTEAITDEVRDTIGNPWVDSDYNGVYDALGIWMSEPSGATNVNISLNESDKLAEMTFDYGEHTLSYVYRVKSTSAFEDISGLYYDWDVDMDSPIAGCEGMCKRAFADNETIDLCQWFDKATGTMYSLSTSAADLDGFDITAIAIQLYAPVEEEYTGFMPANFLEEKLQKDTFSSYDEIIAGLDKDNAYAIIKVYGLDEDLLIIAEGAYDNLDSNMASIEGSIYRNDNGVVKNIGNVFSSGTAYPVSLDSDGCIYTGGNHEVNVSCVSEETTGIMNLIYAYETFDSQGNATYGGFIRSSNQLFGDEKEIAEDDSSVLPELYEKYNKTTPINFTIVK